MLNVESHMIEGNPPGRGGAGAHLFRLRSGEDRALAFDLRMFALDLLAFSLVLIAPLVVLLDYHRYAYLTPEVMMLMAALVAGAAVLAAVTSMAAPLARTFLLAGLLTLFIDMHLHVPRLSSTALAISFIACFAVVGGLLWILREHATKIVSVVFVTLIGLTLLTDVSGTGAMRQESVAAATRS
ncbi:MAG: hypothetical protein ACREUC_08335, partial [Steroidobacteraceae bacterium]